MCKAAQIKDILAGENRVDVCPATMAFKNYYFYPTY